MPVLQLPESTVDDIHSSDVCHQRKTSYAELSSLLLLGSKKIIVIVGYEPIPEVKPVKKNNNSHTRKCQQYSVKAPALRYTSLRCFRYHRNSLAGAFRLI